MICEEPFVKAGQAYPCGKCLPCRHRRKKLWSHRLMMESLCHAENAFVTLTYAEDTMPANMSLDPAILSTFMKRLRQRVEPRRLRFYGVGEYSKVDRPHYHVLLFGYPTCLNGQSMYSKLRDKCCSQCELIRDVWGLGHVYLGAVTQQSALYCCDYIVKNMRRTDDYRLKGRWPEFSRMSLRPGIGYNALWEVADIIMRYRLDERDGDVPLGARVGSAVKPYGRYLRKKLRAMVGRDEASPEILDEEMQAMYEAARVATPMGGEARKVVFKNMLIDAGAQRVKQLEARLKIYGQRRGL